MVCGERIEIDDQQVDRIDPVRSHDRLILPAPPQQSAMDLRVERLDAPVHDLGKAGVVRHFAHFQPGVAQRLGGAAGGEQFDPVLGERAGKVGQAVLIGDRQQCACDRHGLRPYSLSPIERSFLRSVVRVIPRISAAWLWLPSA